MNFTLQMQKHVSKCTITRNFIKFKPFLQVQQSSNHHSSASAILPMKSALHHRNKAPTQDMAKYYQIYKRHFTFSFWDDDEAKAARYAKLKDLYISVVEKEGNKNTFDYRMYDHYMELQDVYPHTVVDDLLQDGFKITKESPKWLRESKYAKNIQKSLRRKKKVYGYYTKVAKKARAAKEKEKEGKYFYEDTYLDGVYDHILKHHRRKDDLTIEESPDEKYRRYKAEVDDYAEKTKDYKIDDDTYKKEFDDYMKDNKEYDNLMKQYQKAQHSNVKRRSRSTSGRSKRGGRGKKR